MYLFSNQLALAAESSRAVHSFGKGRVVYGPQPLSVVTDFVTPSVSTFKSRWFISVWQLNHIVPSALSGHVVPSDLSVHTSCDDVYKFGAAAAF